MRPPLLVLVAVVTVGLAAPALAQTYRVHLSCPALITLPVGQVDPPRVFLRAGDGQWELAEFTAAEGRLTIALDPGKLGGGQAQLLVNPAPGVEIQDLAAPRLVGLRLDGRALATEPSVTVPPAMTMPRRLRLTVADDANAVDLETWRLTLDGERVAAEPVVTERTARGLTLQARLPKTGWGRHTLRYSIADGSPQRNAVGGEIAFARMDLRNAVLAENGTTLKADSYFATYPSLACLQDGDARLPGNTLPNAISWASVEDDSPHWVEAKFGQARAIRQVTIYWANYSHEAHTSRQFEVQLPEGEGWKTVYKSPAEGEAEAASTTVTFAAEKVSGFRVWQPGGGGSVARPDLMWLAEVEAR